MLDERIIAALGSTVGHVRLNRRADATAKACALRIAPVVPGMVGPMTAAATLHQEWLVRLHCHLSTHEVQSKGDNDVVQITSMSLGAAKTAFPKWNWSSLKSDFFLLEGQDPCPTSATCTVATFC